MNKFESVCEAILTRGLANAMNKQMRVKTICDCGFVIPVYPGKYSQECPVCGNDFSKKMDGGKLVDVPADDIDATPQFQTKADQLPVPDMTIDGNRATEPIVPGTPVANNPAKLDDPTKPVSTPGEGPHLDDEEETEKED